MPTYEYECRKCGHVFEKFQNITAEPLRTCPECSGPVKRLIGAGAGIIFKGNGFYQTDYRSESYRKAAASDTPKESSDSGKKAAADSPSKAPAEKTSKKPAESKP